MSAFRATATALFITSAVAVAGPVSAQDNPPGGVAWQSAGDSYSSGEGVSGNKGPCAQSDVAYGPVTAQLLRDDYTWELSNETFTACTGHLVEDYFHARGDTGAENQRSLWEWGVDQGSPERLDVITLSFGGNDIGFADVISDCVVLPDSWTSPKEVLTPGSGCDTSEEELRQRVDHLLDPPRRNCDTNRRNDKAYDCDIAIQGRRGSIIDFYYDVVTNQLTDRGRLYVVGYPRVFADTDQWSRWAPAACAGVKRGDTQKLGRVAEHLNNKLQEAVRRANEALGAERVVFVDRFAYYRDGQHEMCGRGEDWLNGIATNRGDGSFRKETSFHPNAAGHRGVADQLAGIIDRTFPRPEPVPGPSTVDCTDDPLLGTDGVFEYAARCLYQAAIAGDRDSAARFAEPEAVDTIFSSGETLREWEWMGCDQNTARMGRSYLGWECLYMHTQPGAGHGTAANFHFHAYDDIAVVVRITFDG